MKIKMKNIISLLSISVFMLGVSGCVKPDVIIPPGHPEEGFVLGPEDVLEVHVWRNADLSRSGVVVRPDGRISLPLVGDVPASGFTADQLAKNIAEKYKAYKDNPVVSVNVLEINSYYVFVVGEVNSPGKLQLKTYTTILQVISLAGGFTQFASENDISVVRNVMNGDGKVKELRIPIRYDDLMSPDGAAYNITLKTGDTILVP